MSADRPTPETDAKTQITFGDQLCAPGTDIVSGNFARRLERQRDAAVEALRMARQELDGLPRSLGYKFTHLPQIDAVLREIEGKS